MKENNLFSFPMSRKTKKFLSKKQEKTALSLNFKNTDEAFIEKSAQEFANSILLGNLYLELKSKASVLKGNVTRI